MDYGTLPCPILYVLSGGASLFILPPPSVWPGGVQGGAAPLPWQGPDPHAAPAAAHPLHTGEAVAGS